MQRVRAEQTGSNLLAERLVTSGALKKPEIVHAFERIRRSDFLPKRVVKRAFAHEPLSIGSRQTNSDPRIVAQILELLAVRPGCSVLDVGSGSGWLTALLAELVGSTGHVYALEIISKLKKVGERNTDQYGFVSAGRATFFCRNARHGLPKYAPFDRIVVSAASYNIPKKLLRDLAVGGRMVIPLGDPFEEQVLTLVTKNTHGRTSTQPYERCIFVPLVNR